MVKFVQIRSYEKQVTGRLYGQKPGPGNINPNAVLEMLNRSANSGLQLYNFNSVIIGLVIDYDFERQFLVRYQSLNCPQRNPQIIGVEDFEFLD